MIIGTRGSDLARRQTSMVESMLKETYPDISVETRVVRTTGDIVRDRPLDQMGSPGVFTRELDRLILDGGIDAAVNSLKDMPVDLEEGLEIAAVLPRGPVEDVLLSSVPLENLPPGAVVGSSSSRRERQLLASRPDLDVRDIRGNVPTRIRKWKNGEYDAVVLARAGLVRLGIDETYHVLDPGVFVPAPGQGAVAVVCRADSEHLPGLRRLDDPWSRNEVEAERYVLKALGGGCSMPVGVLARRHSDMMHIQAVLHSSRTVRAERQVEAGQPTDGLNDLVRELLGGET